MELNVAAVTTPLRAAATVVLLRDTADGLEVFLMKRHGLSDVLGGACVFPGGKVDAADEQLDAAVHLDQPALVLQAGLNEPELQPATAAAMYVAALREAFEECGVLFAHGLDGAASADLVRQAGTLLGEGHGFNAVLGQLALRLQTRSIVPWSRWITPLVPSVSNKRFDTRFFVAAVPQGQVASHDNFETTDSVWLAPRTALQRYWAGEIELAPPQIMSLAHLARHGDVGSVLAQAQSRPPPVIQPETFDDNGGRLVCYPGDTRHSVRQQALPGPTRLRYRNKRFEPDAGFDALFT